MPKLLSKLIFSSLARQLIFGIAAVHAVLMTIFVFDLVERQREFMLTQSNQQAIGLAATLATNGSSWVLANDLVGIEEIITSQSNYPDLKYAMFIDNQGKVLGYTDRKQIGMYLTDEVSKKIFNHVNDIKVVVESDALIDVAAPIVVNSETIGWARVGISRVSMSNNLDLVTKNGLIYTSVAIVVGIMFAWAMARGLTTGIRQLKTAIDQTSSGSRDVVCELNRQDELQDLGHDFNKMLVTLKEHENKIIKTHEALNLSERKITQLIDNLRTEYVFYSHDTNGIFTYLSPSITEVLGYTNEEYLRRYDAFFTDNPINDNAVEITNKVLQGQRMPPYEVEIFHKDGSKRIMEVTESPVTNSNGKVVAVEGLARDITLFKEVANNLQEEKDNVQREQVLIESIINAIPDRIYYKNSEGVYIGSNKAFNDYIGLSKSEMTGKTDEDILTQAQAAANHNIEKEITLSGKNKQTEDVIADKNGDEKIFDTVHTVFKKDDGEILGYIQISRDITEVRNKEIQLRRSQRMDALGKLTGGIAHDYNNLLGVIIGYSELLSMSVKDDELKMFSDEIMKAGERGSRLTKKLLSFTKNQTVTAASININEILKTDLSMIQKTLTARIEIDLDLQEPLWPLWLDAGDFQDSILNMSINAMHAMPDGGSLHIKTRNITLLDEEANIRNISPGDYVRLSLTDTGCGMDSVTKEQLFDPFFTTKGEKGSGLGLSQVFGFVNRSKGAINIYSELGRGSTFNLYFKRFFESNNVIKKQDLGINTPVTKGEKILVVDDEPALKALAAQILKNNGYTVFEADDAFAALDCLETESVDLVLSDVIMPDMDGYELASMVKEKYPAVKVVLASGFAKQESVDPDHSELTKNLLHKPYSSAELIKAVSDQLRES
ncbi:MAG: PAS domain S-box protein [Gammaproteobacteria bacterium]|nr:PAS domain S-box protein [Gammaproteobacteria bacterium]